MSFFKDKSQLVAKQDALPGRDDALEISGMHTVLATSMRAPFPDDTEVCYFGMGCFWGAERRLWQQPGVITTAVGYMAGYTPNPTYDEVCSGMTGHTEAVMVAYENKASCLENLLKVFWESHDPTQGMRQGNDQGTQYRSGIYCVNAHQLAIAERSKVDYQEALKQKGLAPITTEVMIADEFYYAEEYHQQYLDKNPNGYCGLAGTGVSCSI